MNLPGGTRGVLIGNLKRRLVGDTIAIVTNGETSPEIFTQTCELRGLCSLLDVFVGVSAFQINSDGSTTPLPPDAWPAGAIVVGTSTAAGTLQIIPQSNFPDRGKMQFRPVFQDPTNSNNTNVPEPQALPFSWNFPGECDEAVIVIQLDGAAWDSTGLEVQIVLSVMVEYTGEWWDADACNLALSQVQVTPPGRPVTLGS